MLDNLTKYVGLIPLVAIVIYILGYVSLSAYLQPYNIDENITLDFKILKLGVLLGFLIAPVAFLAFSTFKFGDYTNATPDLPIGLIITLHDAMGYSMIYSLSLAGIFFKYHFDLPTNTMLILLVIATLLNKVPMKPNTHKILKSFYIMIPFFIFCFIAFSSTDQPKAIFYFLQIMAFTACAIYRIFNKEGITYQFSKVGIIVSTIFCTGSLFGYYLIEYIPVKYGGEQKITRAYFINDTDVEKVKQTALLPYLKQNNILALPVVYDAGETYYFKTPSKMIISIPKTYIGATQSAILK